MKLVDVTEIEPSTYNPRIADPARLDLIELSLRKLGFLLPLYATPDGEIISGHQRHHVACRMGGWWAASRNTCAPYRSIKCPRVMCCFFARSKTRSMWRYFPFIRRAVLA